MLLINLIYISILLKVYVNGDNRNRIDQEEKMCNNGTGFCTPYYLCPIEYEVDEIEIIDVRFDTTKECPDVFENCCSLDAITTERPKPNQAQYECGFRNEEGVGFRITENKNKEANFGEFPWMVAVSTIVIEGNYDLTSYKCGGSLINPLVAMTAAHCVHGIKPSSLVVRAGEWDMKTTKELFEHTDHTVTEIKIHDEFNPNGLQNDIALLFLATTVELTDHINTVCLPPQGFNFDGSNCFASGWGKNAYDEGGSYQAILKKVELPVLTKDSCEKGLRNTKLGKHFKLHDSFICAGGEEGVDTCDGDGGSALVCENIENPGYYYQAGIVAWGLNCGQDNVPGVYVNVAKFRNWTDSEIEKHYLSPTSYSWKKPKFVD